MDPIFIIGTERSGSNLLRLILDAHSRIDIPHPPHFMRYFAPAEASYGDLNQDAAMRALVADLLRLVRVHIHPWDVPIDAEEVVRQATPRTLLGAVAAIHDQHRRAKGKARWGNKSTFMLDHVDLVLGVFPGARFVWLVRDPRDVAVSSRKSVFSPFHPYFTACLWRDQQQTCLDLQERLGATVVHRLHYEDLLADSEGELRRLCTFLGEEFEPGMLRFFEGDAARKGARLSESWQNTASPVLRGNSGKWRQELTPDEARVVEAVCGLQMRALGYAVGEGPARLVTSIDIARFRALNAAWHAQVEWRSLRRDDNHWRRWARDGYAAWLRARAHLPGGRRR